MLKDTFVLTVHNIGKPLYFQKKESMQFKVLTILQCQQDILLLLIMNKVVAKEELALVEGL